MNNLIGGNNNFYFIHNTFGYDNLIEILKSGVLKKGSEIEQEKRKLFGGIPIDNVYMSIYFEDIEEQFKHCGLVFSSQILDEYDITVNAGWRGKKICSIKHGDKQKIKKNKINKIKKFIKNPEKILNEELLKYIKNSIMLHEVLFYENIPLDKYLVKIDNCGYTEKQLEEIKKS